MHLDTVLFLLPWTMRQAWVTWCTVELLRQLYWNLMETWPSQTSTQGINFYASWTIAQCSHYSDRLETNEKMKRAMTYRRLCPVLGCGEVFSWSRGCSARLGSPMGLLFKQASNYSLRYATNLRLMQSVCVFSPGLFFFFFSRYSGNWRKSQEQWQTSCDITQVPWAQGVSLLDEIVRDVF